MRVSVLLEVFSLRCPILIRIVVYRLGSAARFPVLALRTPYRFSLSSIGCVLFVRGETCGAVRAVRTLAIFLKAFPLFSSRFALLTDVGSVE